MELLKNVVKQLSENKTLEQKYRDHALTGKYSGFRECHLQPDWLLIYYVEESGLLLVLTRTGTHGDLFGTD